MKRLLSAAAVVCAFMVPVSAANAATLYESTFPTGSFGGPCSPCGTSWRFFDQVDLGAPTVTISSIEFAIHDVTFNGAGDINLSIFDSAENLLFSTTQSNTQWAKKDIIDFDNYTVSFSLPDIVINTQVVWISPFGVNGTQFGLSASGGGDGVATQTNDTDASGFVSPNYNRDVAIRVNGTVGAAVVPLPAGLPLLLTGIGGLAWLRRRKSKAVNA